jgi:YidC/Oxa1 family membrane protein insertase
MDKKSIVGILIIFLILVIFSMLNRPSQERVKALKEQEKHYLDSIAKVEAQNKKNPPSEASKSQLPEEASVDEYLKAKAAGIGIEGNDTLNQMVKIHKDQFGKLWQASIGKEEFYTIENNLLKITFSNKGGKIYSVELKKFKTHDSLPLLLFNGDKTVFGINFSTQDLKTINTEQLFFTPEFQGKTISIGGTPVKMGDEGNEKNNAKYPGETKSASFKVEVEPGKAIEYVYTLKHNSYMVGFDVKLNGMNEVFATNQSYLDFVWSFDVPRQEKISNYGEDRYTNIQYKFNEGDLEQMSPTKSDQKNLSTKVKWISFKQLFFNSTIISGESFPNALVKSEKYKNNLQYLSNFYADITLPYEAKPSEKIGMQFFFGPNHYKTLRQYDMGLERLVYLGYAIVRPVNKYIVIPVFNFLRKYVTSFGLIILLLTVFIKTLVFPFTYTSYQSQAKMRVLKPEVDELTAKYGPDKAMEKQQATMALYKKAGVNPLGGCLPMLLQFPFLVAMFFFFPTSIELRQQSFLWAHDLSTYDSILKLPFTIPLYGDHVSLFCLLMTATTIITTSLNSQSTANSGMPGMKAMMYIMPIFFMFILNSYSSGLSYYYFLANLITIGQTYLMRAFVDEDKIHAQLQANKKKPVKKSNFQKRLEEAAKQRGVQLPKK